MVVAWWMLAFAAAMEKMVREGCCWRWRNSCIGGRKRLAAAAVWLPWFLVRRRRGEEVRRRLPWWWKERRKFGLGFWEMKMMTWQSLSGQFGEVGIATWHDLVEWSLSGRRGAT